MNTHHMFFGEIRKYFVDNPLSGAVTDKPAHPHCSASQVHFTTFMCPKTAA